MAKQVYSTEIDTTWSDDLDEMQILNMVGHELSMASGGSENDYIESNRQAAYAMYLGQPDGNEVAGRSRVTSTDVADAIEWIMPEIVKAFTQNNDVVHFDPNGDGDEQQAELESQYVYDILMKDNNGFLVIHQFVKDALMQKNGFIKVTYDKQYEVSNSTYTGLTDLELDLVLANPQNELIEHTIEEYEGIASHDVKVRHTKNCSQINVTSVPPEEFRVARQHNSVDVSTSRFTAHVMIMTAGDLVEMGFDPAFVDEIPSSEVFEDDRQYRFYMMNENVYPDNDIQLDASMRQIEVAECYMYMDIDGDGIAEYVKVTVAGGDEANVLLDIEEIDYNPFISSTAILMSHKLFGLSIYDRLKSIQEQKTTLWRNIFDNMYLQNNQRSVVLEGQVNLDDVLTSRPGGVIRAKTKDAVTPYVTPPLPGDAYKMMDYLDQVRAGRSGVSPEGAVTESMVGDRVGSEGIDRMMNQKEELVGLMIRVIAETGIKPLCILIRDLVIKHQDVARDYMYRGQWVQVDPSKWKDRKHTTVRVGTGSGNRKEQRGAITAILSMLERISGMPGQALVTDQQVFNAADDFAKFSGMPGIRSYMLDPSSPQGQQNKAKVEEQTAQAQKAQQAMDQAQAEATIKVANAEERRVAAESANVQLKNEVETQKNMLKLQEQQFKSRESAFKQHLERIRTQLEAEGKSADLEFKYYDSDQRRQIEEKRIDTQKEIALSKGKTSENKAD